jgi:hypothetical protein
MRGRVCRLQLFLAHVSAAILGSESRGNHDDILLPQIRDSPNLRARVTQLYPQTLGPLFVASYDSQGYGGCNRTSVYAGINRLQLKLKLLSDWRFTANQFVLAPSPLRLTTRDFFFSTEPLWS